MIKELKIKLSRLLRKQEWTGYVPYRRKEYKTGITETNYLSWPQAR